MYVIQPVSVNHLENIFAICAFIHPSIKMQTFPLVIFRSKHLNLLKCFLIRSRAAKISCLSERGDNLDGGWASGGQAVGAGNADVPMRALPEERNRRSKEELRELWRTAILQQILLQRMERENQKLQGKFNR